MKLFGWRLLFVAGFLPLGLPFALWAVAVIIAASITWVFHGPDQRDGEDRLERWLHHGDALDWPLDKLMRKADVLRELWVSP